MKKAGGGVNKPGKFSLLRWVAEEQVGVVSSSSIHPGQKCYVGAIGEFKWQSRYYEAEILKISGNIWGVESSYVIFDT